MLTSFVLSQGTCFDSSRVAAGASCWTVRVARSAVLFPLSPRLRWIRLAVRLTCLLAWSSLHPSRSGSRCQRPCDWPSDM
ncbi:hypothetical protein PAXRUDRAFT_586107 [Paxillus rubicundulus Ve08.2h10]|uniref:Uncharacterized protein n=1 Tax=Paxillus rubicundulus Ve08.2h10 TaxID=930991 RepID=A0A0D0CRY6_9AGAM|nr:hypothetical protein PAXRUDRAFT_586107 [Paxillus rubicundulus Ve08.2h10]